MKKLFAVPLVCVALAAGCASSAQMRHAEEKSSANQKVLRETDQRLHTLEQNVAVLDSQVAQLRNRSFEVRTQGGKKTGMTVVPILPPAAQVAAIPAGPASAAVAPLAAANAPGASAQAVLPEQQQLAALGKHGPGLSAAPAATTMPVATSPAATPPVVSAAAHTVATAASAAPAIHSGSASSGAMSSGAGVKTASKISAASSAGVDPAPAAASASASTPAAGSGPEGPRGRIIDPAAPARPFPSAGAAASGPAAPASRAPEAVRASGQSVTAGPHGQVGEAANKQLAAGNGETLPLGLPPVAAPQPSTPPVVDPVNFAAPNAGQPVVPAAAGKSDPAGGNAAVPVPQLPPSTLALPPEHPGLPPLEAPAANAKSTAAPAAAPGSLGGSLGGSPAASPAGSPSTILAGSAAAARQPGSPQNVSSPPEKAPAASSAAQAPVRSGKGEKAAYEAALKVVMAGRSAEGISRFETFLQEYPQGSYAPNAEYWIGEGLYAQGKYREALAQFRKVDAAYPQHHKNADALLKTGMCLSRLGDKEAASQAYNQLMTRFPKSEAARLARARGLAR